MAAVFYAPTPDEAIFRSGLQVNTSVSLPFLSPLIGTRGFCIVNEVTIQNRDTIQYFLTFDDLISYFYFGKGLGSMNISGMMLPNCNNYFPGANMFNNMISTLRGKTVPVSFGNAVFLGVISAFTVRADGEANTVDFNLQLDIVDHSLVPPRFNSAC